MALRIKFFGTTDSCVWTVINLLVRQNWTYMSSASGSYSCLAARQNMAGFQIKLRIYIFTSISISAIIFISVSFSQIKHI